MIVLVLAYLISLVGIALFVKFLEWYDRRQCPEGQMESSVYYYSSKEDRDKLLGGENEAFGHG